MSTPNLNPIWPSMTYKWADVGTIAVMLLLGIFVGYQAFELGAGYGRSGPAPGFWPFWLNAIFIVGLLVAFVQTLRNPDDRPFFEAKQEVIDMVSVGAPILAAVILNYWLGIFVTSALYLAFFMFWYEKFTWYTALASGIGFAVVLWLMMRKGFNLSMPMSWLYYQNITPF